MPKTELEQLAALLARFASEHHGYGSEPCLTEAAELIAEAISEYDHA